MSERWERWRVDQLGQYWSVYGSNGRYIGGQFERESDALLAAAAPAMREALEVLVFAARTEPGLPEAWQILIEAGNAALAAARGAE